MIDIIDTIIFQYEEERLLSSGRARVAGLATRMELAWHKERDEQQRLLQETSTLARDLRQTLFEVNIFFKLYYKTRDRSPYLNSIIKPQITE